MQYLNKTQLKNDYNFTDKNIQELLPEPKIVKNPYYSKSNMYLWNRDEVNLILEKEEVQEVLKSNKKRKDKFRESIKIVNDKKRELTKKEYTDAAKNIKITVISLKELKVQTLNHVKNFKNRYQCDCNFNSKYIKESDLIRWEVNYIRHILTKYDDLLEIGYRKIGNSEGQKIIIEAIYKKIAEQYPSLKDECERQLIEHIDRWNGRLKIKDSSH